MKISAVCFDLGKVLLDFDKEAMLVRMAKQSALSPAEMTDRLKADEMGLAYEVGAVSTPEFFAHLKHLLEFQGTTEELNACYSEIFTPLVEHISLAALLAPHYPLAIISNTNEAHIVHAETTYSFFTLFPVRIYSHVARVMKPDRAIYDAALTALSGVDPLETLFILGAVQLGWQTIHLRPDVNLRHALASYDLKGLD